MYKRQVPLLTFARCVIVLIRSGKLSLNDWKSQEFLPQKTCRRDEFSAESGRQVDSRSEDEDETDV